MPGGGGSAVVTGAGRGIGEQIARLLAARGLTVVVTDIDEEAARRVAGEIGGIALVQDVRDPDSHREAARAAQAAGELRVWVNNAGVLYAAPAWRHSDAEVTRTIEVNLLGTLHGSRAAVDAMHAGTGRGDVVNVVSVSAHGPVPGLGVYAASKAGALGFTTSLAGDLRAAGSRVRVHALCPDTVATGMVHAVATDPSASLLFTGGGLLDAHEVARAAVQLVGTDRLVRSVPGWRAALVRVGGLIPGTAARRLMPAFERFGRGMQRRRHAP
ncbi:SDR family oxidoreductase [Streptomyces sp. NA04227]|uniref:SDR family oxidoreductase n=1 Tax=Streptomyces sp. NA04227 TaxID=2742136 RepID=UPI0015923C7D|nr:SDR family oxidoreductase [Streptomyces sp. NA04227]QKW07538.1 SDR family oxidoreductase [Streptomyces sp. NA04227]